MKQNQISYEEFISRPLLVQVNSATQEQNIDLEHSLGVLYKKNELTKMYEWSVNDALQNVLKEAKITSKTRYVQESIANFVANNPDNYIITVHREIDLVGDLRNDLLREYLCEETYPITDEKIHFLELLVSTNLNTGGTS